MSMALLTRFDDQPRRAVASPG